MRLMVTGANGQVGFALTRSLAPLGEVIALGREQCDLARPERLPSLVRDMKPNVIVNAAAYNAVDRAEQEEELAVLVNGTAVGVLAEEARRAGALFIHYSTDYVFDGKKTSPYTEDDSPWPLNAYGRSKLKGETAVKEAGGDSMILRTSWVYAARGHNFVRTILRLAREREELAIVNDQLGAPTWARDIASGTAAVVEGALRERKEGRFTAGLLHMTASGATSWCDFARAILELARGSALLPGQAAPRLRPIASKDYPQPALRPQNSRLSSERLSQRFGIVLPDWQKALALCLEEMKTCER